MSYTNRELNEKETENSYEMVDGIVQLRTYHICQSIQANVGAVPLNRLFNILPHPFHSSVIITIPSHRCHIKITVDKASKINQELTQLGVQTCIFKRSSEVTV
jgi:hypothetical protein